MKKNVYLKDFDYYIDEYMYNCQSRKLRPKTMMSCKQTLRLFERWCLEEEKIAGERFAFVPLPMFSKSLPITFSQSILLLAMLLISLPPPSLKIPQRRCSVPTKECPRSEASPMAVLIEEFALGVKPENLNILNLAFHITYTF